MSQVVIVQYQWSTLMSSSVSSGFLFKSLNKNTSFPAFILQDGYEIWNEPVQKMRKLSTPAEEPVAVSNCFATIEQLLYFHKRLLQKF